MKLELDKKLVSTFPLLYSDRHAPNQHTAMCWGFSCGDGWFPIIWNLSLALEPLIQKYINDHPNIACHICGCTRDYHYASATSTPGKCLSIHVNPDIEALPPKNYMTCHCEKYSSMHPRAAQVKEKYGRLRFYMTSSTPEMFDLIKKAEELSAETCEICASPGEERSTSWIHTHCDYCHENWDVIRSNQWKTHIGENNKMKD